MKPPKLSSRACLILALATIPVAAVARSLILLVAPDVWPWFFGAIIVGEEVVIWRLFTQNQRLEESDRQAKNSLQLAVAEGQKLALEKSTLESRTRSLEERDQFLGEALSGATHALKNPLTNISLVLSRLSHEDLSPEGEERLELARSQVQVATQLANDLLDYLRLDSNLIEPHIEKISLEYWLPEVIKMVAPRAIARKQTINCSVEKCEPLLSDKLMLGKVVMELLTNACKYSPSRSEIEAIALFDNAIEKYVIEVRNTGKIPFLEKDKIWESFYRPPHGDPYKQGGHGFGLSLTKKLLKKLDGNITMTSMNNKVTFRVEL